MEKIADLRLAFGRLRGVPIFLTLPYEDAETLVEICRVSCTW